MAIGHLVRQEDGCSVYRNTVTRNSIFFSFCAYWVHIRFTGIRSRISAVNEFNCRIYTSEIIMLAGQRVELLVIGK